MKRITSLQGLRVVMALTVFVHHIRVFWPYGFLGNYLYYFYAGVTFFFMLSGFVLTYRYTPVLERHGHFSATRFYLKRLGSVYPLHLIAMLMSFAVIDPKGFSWKTFAEHLLLIQTFTGNPSSFFSFNSLSWFLSDTMFLYLLFPPVLVLLFRTARTPGRRIMLSAAATLAYAAGYVVLLSVFVIKNVSQDYFLFYFSPWARVIDFLTGITLGLAFQAKGGGKKYGYGQASAVEFLLLLSVFVFMYFTPSVPDLLRWDLYFVPLFAVMIFVFAEGRGMLSAWLSRPFMEYLGNLTFPFVMFQWVVITFIHDRTANRTPLIYTLVSLVITLVLSVAYTRGVAFVSRHRESRTFGKLHK